KPPVEQLSLFGSRTPTEAANPLETRFASLRPLAEGLPAFIKPGTSSWSFPGWNGIVYPRQLTKSALSREGLPHYVKHPLLRSVGIDRGYYAPIPQEDLRHYASQLPARFPAVAKVPGSFTTPIHLGHGAEPRGTPNPSFLDATAFTSVVARPFLSAFADHTAALLLEFPPVPRAHRLSPDEFADRLDGFFRAIPSELPYCVEVRDRDLLTPAYAQVLSHHGVAHTFNYWTAMPLPAQQATVAPLDSAPFVVIRLMLRPGTRYEKRRADFAPFDRIVAPDPDMRASVIELLELVQSLDRVALVLVNNKAEGSAPLTIEELARDIVGTLTARESS
ncbi:MAG: DUF72 domain-containing protein, partial [Myxococcota bacterium]